jgi:hypothetical protein
VSGIECTTRFTRNPYPTSVSDEPDPVSEDPITVEHLYDALEAGSPVATSDPIRTTSSWW